MHEAKTRLSELVKAVEEQGEIVVLCRNGVEVAEIHPRSPGRKALRLLTPDPRLRPVFMGDYNSAEPLSGEEWPTGLL